MSTKIDSMTNTYLQITGLPASKTNAPDANGAQARKSGGEPSARGDTVEVTDSARSLQALESRMGEVSEVDQRRVDEVRSRIEAGDYEVNPERVAAKMIAMDRALPDDK